MAYDGFLFSFETIGIFVVVGFIVSVSLRRVISNRVADVIGFFGGTVAVLLIRGPQLGLLTGVPIDERQNIVPAMILAVFLIPFTSDLVERLKPWREKEASVTLSLIPMLSLYLGLSRSGLVGLGFLVLSGLSTAVIFGAWLQFSYGS